MSRTPDPMDMLEVAEQARQEAMARREAALAHLATFALQALVEGHDVREIARRCGFMLKDEPEPAADGEGIAEGHLFAQMMGGHFSMYSGTEPRRSPERHFAQWLSQIVKERVEEAFKVGRPV